MLLYYCSKSNSFFFRKQITHRAILLSNFGEDSKVWAYGCIYALPKVASSFKTYERIHMICDLIATCSVCKKPLLNNYQICPFKWYTKGMTNYPQMYQKQSLQYLSLVYVEKGVILHFSKWGFTQATAMCWNDSSIPLRLPPLLVLCYYTRICTRETQLFYQSPSCQGVCA